jgi:hypothetical protein
MHSGIARYHRESSSLAFSRKNTELEKEMMLSNPMMAMKSKPDASKPEIAGLDVAKGMKLNRIDTKLVIQVIRKIADINAREIFIFINSSP